MYHDAYERLTARNYDAVYAVLRDPSGDAEFYRSLAREAGGPVLELGCGTGRTLLPIARDGVDCVGLDASPVMLDVLRAKGPPPNLRLVESGMEDFELGERFALITMPFRAFCHLLDVTSQLATLDAIRRHLAPGGRFAFDVFDPGLARMASDESDWRLAATFHDGGHELRRWDSVTRDPTTQISDVRFRFEGGPPELSGIAEFSMRWFYRYELEHLLVRAGFASPTFYRDFQRTEWSAGGEIIVVAGAGEFAQGPSRK